MQQWLLDAQQDRAGTPLRNPDEMQTRYGHEPALVSVTTTRHDGLQVQVRRYNQCALVTAMHRTPVQASQKCCEMVFLDNANVVGVLQFTRYKVRASKTDYAFYEVMQAHGETNREIAEVFLSHWRVKDLYRPLLILDTLWIAPSHRAKLDWHTHAIRFLRTVRADLLLLKLTANHTVYPDMLKPASHRRQSALQRLLRRKLLLRPLPGDDAWMYKTSTGFSAPQKRRWRM